MFITVAICTWNRAKLLELTLERMLQLRVPAGVEWELLVVDNNCTDDTPQVLARFRDRLPLRHLLERRQGHSHARNCAIAAASGEFLLWTDDDVLVAPDWLAAYADAFRAWPDAAFFGGAVLPWYSIDPPGWVRKHLAEFERIFVLTNHGPDVRPLRPEEYLVGASMAFRTSVLRDNPFNTDLGRVKGRLTGADDSEMIQRLRRQGLQGVWVGTALLQHYIPAERMTTAFLRAYYVGAGRTHVRQHGMPKGRTVFGVPVWVLRGLATEQVKAWVLSPSRGSGWLAAFRQANIFRGVIQEARERRAEEQAVSRQPDPVPEPRSSAPAEKVG